MIPSVSVYPKFVPDQLLTSENLNDLRGYLEEDGRLTRTNLLGVGIACGFEVKTSSDGSTITVTGGTGTTSAGYLVAQEERNYTQYVPFDPGQELYYEKFLDSVHQKQFDLWELKQSAAIADAMPLSLPFLDGYGVADDKKVVLLFVELLEQQNKNCNPESCDDKGISIRVNLRPLLVRKQDADKFALQTGSESPYYDPSFVGLPEIRMPRFDVPWTSIHSAAGLLTAYKRVLTGDFLHSIDSALNQAWQRFRGVLESEYEEVNPFSSLVARLAFVHASTITSAQLSALQYVFDHVCDLLVGYDEFRHAGMDVLRTCCPDADMFPRHLLLDLAISEGNEAPIYRHYFRPSPLFQRKDLHGRLRSLFRRLVLLVDNFKVPEPSGSTANPDDSIRVTPSRLGTSPLSDKAIPYYYDVTQPRGSPLYQSWSYEKTRTNRARSNLSYHAPSYSRAEFVRDPLRYDLEPYNFLRVEGHIGKSFSHVLQNLRRIVKDERLPIDVVGICLSADASDVEVADPAPLRAIQVQYEVLKAEVVCCLRRQLEYWGKLTVKESFGYGKLNLASNLFSIFTKNLGILNLLGETAPGAAEVTLSAGSRKGRVVQDLLQLPAGQQNPGLFQEYLKYQEAGDYSLSRIPPPAPPGLSQDVISHFALQILDEISELLVLLEAESPLTLDVEAVTRHARGLEATLEGLLDRVEKEIRAKRPFQKIKAYVGEAQHSKVDALADAMPELGEDQANSIVLLLLNLAEEQRTTLIGQIASQKGNVANQVALINLFYGELDKNTMKIPPAKEVPVLEDAFLREMRDRLKSFSCLCGLPGFGALRSALRQLLDELKQAHLFSVFAAKHPGIQHKAGVTMGGTFIVAYHRKGNPSTDSPDATYQTRSAEFQDGMVVADFYLPYLSYSNHPPVIYQVIHAEAPPEVVMLELAENPGNSSLVFSVGDERSYAFEHVPGNGRLINGTVVNGVTSPTSDSFVFTPSRTADLLGDESKVEIRFNYVKNGVTSNDVLVTVFNLPSAEIGLEDEEEIREPGAEISIAGNTRHTDTFRWMLRDGDESREIATSKDLSGFALEQEGTFVFTLHATQSETGVEAVSNPVSVRVRRASEARITTCGSLPLVTDAFGKLGRVDPQQFSRFQQEVLSSGQIVDYFAKLKDVSTRPELEQLRFLGSRVANGALLSSALGGWMATLATRVLDARVKPQRLLALETYRVLANLAMYQACLRKEDLSETDQQVFANMVLHIRGDGRERQGFLRIVDLTAAEQAVLGLLEEDFMAEAKRNVANNRILPKPLYSRALKAVVAAFER